MIIGLVASHRSGGIKVWFTRARVGAIAAVGGCVAAAAAAATPASAAPHPKAPITVRTVAPANGPVGGGTRVTLRGSGFGAATKVLFGRAPGTRLHNRSSTELTVIAPRHTAGTVNVRVVSSTSLSPIVRADRFTFHARPTVSRVSPGAGALAGGEVVTITGTGLEKVSRVEFGGHPAMHLTRLSSTRLSVVAPQHALGTVDVRVITAFGRSPVTPADQYMFVDTSPPAPVSGVAASATTEAITLSWTNPDDPHFAGVRIRRAAGSTPPGADGGVLVADTIGSSFTDTGLPSDTTYSYSLFAYSSAETYASAATATARTSSLPGVSEFAAESGPENVVLSWVSPAHDAFQGIMIRRAVGNHSPPYSTTDGTLVADLGNTTADSYVDSDVVAGVPYSYSLFVYDSTGRPDGFAWATATPSCVFRSVVHVSGSLIYDTPWSPDCAGTYVIDSPGVTVPAGMTLTVAPGTVVKAGGGVGITVYGSLVAAGTPAAPVTFTSIDDDSAGTAVGDAGPAPGDWSGLSAGQEPTFDTDPPTATLDIEHARVDYGANPVAAVNSRVTVTDTTIAHAVNEAIVATLCPFAAVVEDDTLTHTATRPGQAPVYLSGQIDPNTIGGLQGSGNGMNATAIDGVVTDPDATLDSPATWPLLIGHKGPCGPTSSEPFCAGSLGALDGRTLRIPPGSVVKFAIGATLDVQSTLDAVGTAASPIRLTSIYDNSVGGRTGNRAARAGDWGGVDVGEGHYAPSGTFAYVQIRYAVIAIWGEEAAMSITHCTLSNTAEFGIDITSRSTPPVVEDNTVDDSASVADSVPIKITGVLDLDTISGNGGARDGRVGTYLSGGVVRPGTLRSSPAWPTVIGVDVGCIRSFQSSCDDFDGLGIAADVTIAPGTVLKFLFDASLGVSGNHTLTGIGSAAAPIILTSVNDNSVGPVLGSGNPLAGDWGGVSAGPSGEPAPTPSLHLAYVTIAYAKSPVTAKAADITVTHCTIHDATGIGIDAVQMGIPPVVHDNTIDDAATSPRRSAIELSGALDPNTVFNNRGSGNGEDAVRLDGTIVASGALAPAVWPTLVVGGGGGLDVPAGISLELEPDSVLKFEGREALTVRGALDSAGTVGHPVTLTSDDDNSVGAATGTGSPTSGSWSGLLASGDLAIDHTTLKYAITAIDFEGRPENQSVHNTWFVNNVIALADSDFDRLAPSTCPSWNLYDAQGNTYGPDKSGNPYVTQADHNAIQSALDAGAATSPGGWTDHVGVGTTDLIRWRNLMCEGAQVLSTPWQFY